MDILNPPMNKIKHADWPYILLHIGIYLLLLLIAGWLLENTAEITAFFSLTSFLILLTFFHIYRLQKCETEQLQHKIQAIGEVQKLLPLRAPIQPMTGWAATPELAVTVLRQIIFNKPNTILELGSGVTTLINGYGLEKYNSDGLLISLDHSSEYTEITRKELHLHELNNYVNLQFTPLKDIELNNEYFRWYDLSNFSPEIKIDLLIVDGPPVNTVEYARYPALPLLADYLSKSCTIIIHDTNRKEETGIVKRWLKEFPEFTADIHQTDKGITVLSRQ